MPAKVKDRTSVAVLLPCYNEAIAIAPVVKAFRAALPDAAIYVFDNNSTDGTAEIARNAGAIVRHETLKGKGFVVRRMFRDIQADLYVIADGDDTYDAALAPAMIALARKGPYDLVNCIRRDNDAAAYRAGHRLGNRMLTGAVQMIFGDRVEDMLSGYKVLSRRFVKSFPALSTGFDIETEIAVHALELTLPIAHVEGEYRSRPDGSESKLRTYRDGWRIMRLIIRLLRHERPLGLFGTQAIAAFILAGLLIAPVIRTFLETGLVPRLPTAVLVVAIVMAGSLSLTAGIILDTVSRGRREARMLAYLQHEAPAELDEAAR